MKTAHAVAASLLATLTLSTLAQAEERVPAGPPGSVLNTPSHAHRLDVGGSFGFNNAGGVGFFTGFGVAADVRLVDFLSLGAGVGGGLWGPRFTAHSRVYPLGVSRSFFLQGALAYNLGHDSYFDEDSRDEVRISRAGATTANASLGYRMDLGSRGWLAFEAGWAFRLRPAEYRATGRRELTDAEEQALRFSRPGGILLGISGGFSVL
ncbi:hypothetical protein [Pyxidicoccus trucidator]|uniref:hypothetical protein n=1 Tax=Pyxidicoccus trucidator TaxID=2709662 RepID=UPI0013DD7EFB|nr:hypothetical protein [Pyxidicoccus trucidator]